MQQLISLPLLMVILAGIALAVLGLSYKMAGARGCRPMPFSAVSLGFATLLAGGRACCETTAWADPRLWLLGGFMGLLLYGTLALVVTVNRLGPASVSWTLLNLSILVPIFLAPLLLHEPFLAVDAGLVVLFILMLLALRRGMQGTADDVQSRSWRFWALLAAVFLMNGSFQFCSKLKDTFFHDGSAAGLAAIFYGSGMLLALLTHGIQTRSRRFTRSEWGVGILAGACSGIGNLLLLNGMSLPVMVAFPVTQGIALLGGVLLTALVYRERFNLPKIIGLLLSLAVLLLAVLREPLDRWLTRGEVAPVVSLNPPVLQALTYVEPFGIPHAKEILELPLTKPVDPANTRLLDAAGKEVTFQVSTDGKTLLLRTDLGPKEKLTWKLVAGKPTAAAKGLVTVTEDEKNGWIEVTNGLTGVRIPDGKTFTDEWALLDDKQKEYILPNGWALKELKTKLKMTPTNPAPVQGIRLRDGRWTANGSRLNADPFCASMKVEFLARGPLETAVKVHYEFKAKNGGGDGHYTCIVGLKAGQPTIEFEEDADFVPVGWGMNILPEVNFDTARHPAGNPVKTTDTTDFTYQNPWHGNAFGRLWPFGEHPYINYYYLLLDSKGDDASPVVGVFVDKSGNDVGSLASGAQVYLKETSGGFYKAMEFGWPDGRFFPVVHQKWGLFVGTKGKDAPSLDKWQPIEGQMERLAGRSLQLRQVTATIPELPRLNWEERSDWLNVKTKFGAVGDGKADDTAAIQAALDSLKDGFGQPNTVYLPPGVYRITKTLSWRNLYGKRLIGHGRDTRIVWDSSDPKATQVMFHSDGATAGVLFEGIIWDGAGKASTGILHASSTRYESAVVHRNELFINLGTGIYSGEGADFPCKRATAEVLFDNCLFVNVGNGILFLGYNQLDNTVTNCGFYYCTSAIRNITGNVYVRDCHFEASREIDIYSHVGNNSALRCTSVGSQRFLQNDDGFVLQDCHVEGWKSPKGAVVQTGSPFTIFDCTFTNPPSDAPPVMLSSAEIPVILSNCKSEGTKGLLGLSQRSKTPIKPLLIPAGQRGPAVTSARQTFFRSDVQVGGKVFDAKRDFGAKGDGKTDDTDAIMATIAAAREHGKGALAYLPNGQYLVKKTIEVTGEDYFVGGAGCCWDAGTAVRWAGPAPAEGGEVAIFHVKNARNIKLAGLKVGSAYCDEPGVISILHEGSDGPSLVTYDDVGGFTQFRGLGRQDRVFIGVLFGIADFDNCQRATILFEQFHPSRHPQSKKFDTTLRVRGKDQSVPKDGFLGLLSFYNSQNPYDITVQDSQNLVISDYYTEQTWRVLLMEGNAGDTPGRVTMLCHKFHGEHVDDLVNVRNYNGGLYLTAAPIAQVPITDPEEAKKAGGGTMQGVKVKSVPMVFSHTGANPFDIMMVGGNTVFKTEPSASMILPKEGQPWPPELGDAEKAKIAAAFDDLRRLGEVYMEFKGNTK